MNIEDQSTGVAAAIAAGRQLAAVTDIATTQGAVPIFIVPEGSRLETLEKLLDTPRRLAQTVALSTPAALVAYLTLFAESTRSVVFASRKSLALRAILDYHSSPAVPSWNEHRAGLQLTHPLPWQKWISQNSAPMTQVAFGQFLEDNLPDIAFPDGAVLLELVRNFEAKKTANFQSAIRAEDGSVDFVYNEDVQGTARNGKMKVPAVFELVLAPFDGAEPRIIVARLRYRVEAGGKLVLWYDLLRVAEHLDKAFDALIATLNTDLKGIIRADIIPGELA